MKHQMRDPSPWGLGKPWSTGPGGLRVLEEYRSWMSTGPGGPQVLEAYGSWRPMGPGGVQVQEVCRSWRSTGPGGLRVLEVYRSWRSTGPGVLQVLEVFRSRRSKSPAVNLKDSSVNHHLIMVEEFAYPNEPGSYAVRGSLPLTHHGTSKREAVYPPGGLPGPHPGARPGAGAQWRAPGGQAYVHGARLGPVRTTYVDTPVSSGPTNRRTSMKGLVQCGLGGRPRRRPWRSDPRLSSSTLGFSRSSERVASLRLRVGERVLTRLRIQAAEMSFLPREAGLRIRDRVRSSDIREGLGVEPLLLHIERSQLGTKWRDYISHLAWERLGVPPEELMEVAGERAVWAPS
ncbi:hypothetical protein D4764_15G0005890 [Takifugu flavidus]|uniref:Uncharacterized protein n=1 Tax=Takifugu flavidus TaxID=433684 RepID=A0A5C6P1K2_9TELE|nr:hypothetical protein D4764_15G0005890 [Takifugu flavidus]